MANSLDLSIVVVSYRSGHLLCDLIRSIDDAAHGLSWRATVVDNWPDGEDLSAVEMLDDRVGVVATGRNLGYSGGLNIGTALAPDARFIVFLNPDLVLRPHALRQLAQELADGAAAAVPLLVDEHGDVQHSLRREPTLLSALGEAVFGDRFAGRPKWLSETVRDADRYLDRHAVDWATGAALAVRADIVRAVGPWDSDRFFLYSEETDYSRRIRECGGEIVFVPSSVVAHRGGGSGTSPQLDALLEVNKLRYYRKWHGATASSLFCVLLLARNLARPHRRGAVAAVHALLSPRARAALPGGAR